MTFTSLALAILSSSEGSDPVDVPAAFSRRCGRHGWPTGAVCPGSAACAQGGVPERSHLEHHDDEHRVGDGPAIGGFVVAVSVPLAYVMAAFTSIVFIVLLAIVRLSRPLYQARAGPSLSEAS